MYILVRVQLFRFPYTIVYIGGNKWVFVVDCVEEIPQNKIKPL